MYVLLVGKKRWQCVHCTVGLADFFVSQYNKLHVVIKNKKRRNTVYPKQFCPAHHWWFCYIINHHSFLMLNNSLQARETIRKWWTSGKSTHPTVQYNCRTSWKSCAPPEKFPHPPSKSWLKYYQSFYTIISLWYQACCGHFSSSVIFSIF